MQHYILCPNSGGLFLFSDFKNQSFRNVLSSSALYKIVYNNGITTQVYVNNRQHTIKKGEILFCKPLHTLEILAPQKELKVLAFNKDFYGLPTLEEESDFYTFWFFSVQYPHKLTLNTAEQNVYRLMFDNIQSVFEQSNRETETHRDILKHLIKVTSIRVQTVTNGTVISESQLGVIKKFNQLIMAHFKKKATIEDVSKILTQNTPALLQFFNKYFRKKEQTPTKELIIGVNRPLKLRNRVSRAFEQKEFNTVFYNSRINIKNTPLSYKVQDT